MGIYLSWACGVTNNTTHVGGQMHDMGSLGLGPMLQIDLPRDWMWTGLGGQVRLL